MFKTGFKAFVFSFSVSLFAILAAHRAFLHKNPSVEEPLQLNGKNIVLFLKNMAPSKSPTQKVALTALPEISTASLETPQDQETEVILANSFENVDIPLEVASEDAMVEGVTVANSEPLVTADVLYAPDLPQAEPEIEAEAIYKPEVSVAEQLAPPPSIKIVEEDSISESQKIAENNLTSENEAKVVQNDIVPLKKTARPLDKNKHFVIGNPDDMNHVAMSDIDVPIESMVKPQTVEIEEQPQQKEWKSLDDGTWLVARASAGTKNLFMKEKAEKSKDEVKAAFAKVSQVDGTQIATEGGVDNLMIPLKEELKDPNLTPKLAYPSSSEDAVKERLMAEEEKKEEEKKEKVLSAVEEDEEISLDAPKQEEEPKPVETAKKEENKVGLLSRLNSMISGAAKDVTEAKDKAIAKAQARRSLKKRLAKTQPVSIMPTEIRLSFQPNRAEISGQTLRWVQAFASKAAESSNVILEIRMDGTNSPVLQQRRLNLLHNILTHKGVEYSKINTVFTSREPNSFILRAIKPKRGNMEENRKTDNRYQAQYIQW